MPLHHESLNAMTYLNPFNHHSTPVGSSDDVITMNGIYTIVTENDVFAHLPITQHNIDTRYDIVEHLPARAVRARVVALLAQDREVAIFRGRILSPRSLPRHIPAGYVLPGPVWCKVTRTSN